MVTRILDALTRIKADERWCGHRVWLLDGSSCSLPDTPEWQRAFGQPACGFLVAHLLTLFHASTRMLQKILPAPLRTHDLADAWRMHPELQAGDVLLADRGLCSFAHLALLVAEGLHGLFRQHQRTIVSFRKGRIHRGLQARGKLKRAKGLPCSRWLRWLGHLDQVVEYSKHSGDAGRASRRVVSG
jgi:hypothetical protein